MQCVDTHENLLWGQHLNCADLILDLGVKSIDIVHNNATHIFNVGTHTYKVDMHKFLLSPYHMLFETYAYHVA